jgi:hypothetical protein
MPAFMIAALPLRNLKLIISSSLFLFSVFPANVPGQK